MGDTYKLRKLFEMNGFHDNNLDKLCNKLRDNLIGYKRKGPCINDTHNAGFKVFETPFVGKDKLLTWCLQNIRQVPNQFLNVSR